MGVNIKKYATFFHDGDLREIFHKKNETILVMESAQLLPEWNEDNIELSKRDTIAGKLHLLTVKSVLENQLRQLDSFRIKETFDNANIYTFRVNSNKILLEVWWVKYLPKYEEMGVFRYDIEADEIFWENIPSLSDQYWENL